MASCTGTTAAMSATCSPGACRPSPSDSCAKSDEEARVPVDGAVRTAREVVELYNLVVWNECSDLQLAEELFADNVIRHDVGESHTLTRGSGGRNA